MKKKTFLFILLLFGVILVPVAYAEYWHDLTRGIADTLYCSINGDCTMDDLTILGDLIIVGEVFNATMTIINFNVTGLFTVEGDMEINGTMSADTFIGNGSQLESLDCSKMTGTPDNDFCADAVNTSSEIWAVVDNNTFVKKTGDTMTGNLTISTGINANPTIFFDETGIDNAFRITSTFYATNYLKFIAVDGGVETTRFEIRRRLPGINVYSNMDFGNDWNLTNVDCLELDNKKICEWGDVNVSDTTIDSNASTGCNDGYYLDGDGNCYLTDYLKNDTDARFNLLNATGNTYLNDTTTTSLNVTENLNVVGNVNVTGNVYLNKTLNVVNGQVGIGTGSPDSIFHIKANVPGGVGSASAGQIIIQNPADDNTSNVVITGYESDGSGNPDQQLWYLGSSSTSHEDIIFLNRRDAKLQLATDGTSRLTILGNGSVGIGTTNPTAKLHISTVTGGEDLLFLRDQINTADLTIGSPTGALMEIRAGVGDHLQLSSDATANQGIRIRNDGNVGIGTTAPSHRLNVVGNVNVTGNLTLGEKITFALGGIIDNIKDGIIKVTVDLFNITGNLNVGGNLTVRDFGSINQLVVGNYTFADLSDSDSLTVVDGFDLIHTSTHSDDHAFEIELNANGFGDVKAIDIVYTTGAITTGQDEEAILINIDEFGAIGGTVIGLEVISTEGSANVYGMEVGAIVNPILQLSGEFSNESSATVNGVDRLTEFLSTGLDIDIFVNDNDNITIGSASKFEEIEFIFNTTSSGAGITPVFKFSTGVGIWTEFNPTDGTNGMRNNGVVVWLDEDVPTWNTSGGEYLIQITRTKNSLTTNPIENKVRIVSGAVEYLWDKNGDLFVNKINADALSGTYTNGEAYVCVYNNGTIFAKDSTCS